MLSSRHLLSPSSLTESPFFSALISHVGAPLGCLTLWLLPGFTGSQWTTGRRLEMKEKKAMVFILSQPPSLPPIRLWTLSPIRYNYGCPWVALGSKIAISMGPAVIIACRYCQCLCPHFCKQSLHQKMLFKPQVNGSMVKSSCCSCRGPRSVPSTRHSYYQLQEIQPPL